VRKAKLYYIRDLSGKAARIREKLIPSAKKMAKNAEVQEIVQDIEKNSEAS